MATARIGGVNVGFDTVGSASPTLIFVHGFGCDRSDWTAQIRGLSALARVLALDLPGHSESEAAGEASVEAFGSLLNAVRKACVSGPVILVGHSLVCSIILEALLQSSEGVAGLVFLDQNLLGGDDALAMARALGERLQDIPVAELLRRAFQNMFIPTSDLAFRSRALSRMERLDNTFARALLVSAIAWEAKADAALSACRVPALMLQSTVLSETLEFSRFEPDTSTPWTRLVRAHIPDAELHPVSAAGHFLQVEAAAEVNRHLLEFAQESLRKR